MSKSGLAKINPHGKKQDHPTNERGWTADETVEMVREQSRQFTQEEAGYAPDTGDDAESCGVCYFWQGSGRCQVVGGEINQMGASELYINKEDQDAAMGQGEEMGKRKRRKRTDQRYASESKAFSCGESKVVDADQGIVEHLVAVMGNLDLGGDIIHPGAFTKSIVERGGRVKVVDSHNYGSVMNVIGKPLKLWEVDRAGLPLDVQAEFPTATGGLMARTQFLLDTPEGLGAFNRIKAGAVDQYSIGYDPVQSDYSKITLDGETLTARNLREIRLGEYSPVVFAMNEATATVSAKTVTAYQDLPLAPRDRAWDSTAAERRVREWAGGEDNMDWDEYGRAFFWHDSDNPELFGSYKLQYADIVDGEPVAVPRGVFAVAGVLEGARGGTDIPEADQERIRGQVTRYYDKMQEEFDDDSIVPPWQKSAKEMTAQGPQQRLGDVLQGAIHKVFSLLSDEWLIEGILDRDERIMLSSLIGTALDVLSAGMPDDVALRPVCTWYIMAAPDDSETKAGRVLSAANAESIGGAVLALMQVLERAGIDVPGYGTEPVDDEEEKASKGELPEAASAITIINVTNGDELERIIKALPPNTNATINTVATNEKTTAPEKAADNEQQAGPLTAPTYPTLNEIELLELELGIMEEV